MARDERLERKFRAAMGAYPPALEALKRSEFNSDEEFIEACVDYDMQRNDPARAELRRKYARALNEMQEQAEEERKAARRAEIRENMKLTAEEAAEVDATATQAALKALQDGKLDIHDYPEARRKAIETLEKRTLDSKADGAFFNEQIREMYRATRDFDDKTAKEMSKQTLEDLTGGNAGSNQY